MGSLAAVAWRRVGSCSRSTWGSLRPAAVAVNRYEDRATNLFDDVLFTKE